MQDADRQGRLPDPIDRLSEAMSGLLLALAFTGRMSVAFGSGTTVRDVLLAAIKYSVARGIVQATVCLPATTGERARSSAGPEAPRAAPEAEVLRAVLPAPVARMRPGAEVRLIPQMLRRVGEPVGVQHVQGWDWCAAAVVFAPATGATWPPIRPFSLTDHLSLAMPLSNTIAVAMLFAIGLLLYRECPEDSRERRWTIPMVAVTISLGG